MAEFRKGVRQLEAEIVNVLSGSDRERFEKVRQEHVDGGVANGLAARIASLTFHNAALDIVDIATTREVGVVEAARVYFEIGARVGLDWLRDQIEQLSVEGTWQAIARTGLRDGAMRIHRRLAERVLSKTEQGAAHARVAAWLEAAADDLAPWQRTVTEMKASGSGDFATLSVGLESVRKLAD